ncbi:MAG: diaminopimelate decarboxylase [Clostridiales bacterium]|jgi:diaminopimelate decarboxylase|nr:diaminopimelate decarboxylase [Clostridiales bacterium]
MTKNFRNITEETGFFKDNAPMELVREFGSPLYVYNEDILRERCREMANLVRYPRFRPSYSAKANANIRLLEIIRQEGLEADAMSPCEIMAELIAGFEPQEIFYISNNVDEAEMRFAVEKGVRVSVDSLSQLELYGRINPGSEVAVRLNSGVGAGHHSNVITGGAGTKFGVNLDYLPAIKDILNKYNLRLTGINSHIGSLFMNPEPYLDNVSAMMKFAENFEDLAFVDFGGGFGVPYGKRSGEQRMDIVSLSEALTKLTYDFTNRFGDIIIKTEPGRYIAAECGVLLGTVNAVKHNGPEKYIGTDIGFNVFSRPLLYNCRHDIEIYGPDGPKDEHLETVTVVGNICETGDVLARGIQLPAAREGDTVCVLDAGAYGYSMSSNYNLRPRPAEVLIRAGGEPLLIKPRESIEDMLSYAGLSGAYV